MFGVSLALAGTCRRHVFHLIVATPVMRRLGAKRTMLVGMVFGLAGFGLAFAHGSMWLTLVWMAATRRAGRLGRFGQLLRRRRGGGA